MGDTFFLPAGHTGISPTVSQGNVQGPYLSRVCLSLRGFFITSGKPEGRRAASGANLLHQSDCSIRRFTCLLRDCDVHTEPSTTPPLYRDSGRRLQYLLGAKLDVKVLQLGPPGERKLPGISVKLREGWRSSAHT